MPRQILTLKIDDITAGDYLTWCRDPDPPALDYALRSIILNADPLKDTVTAILDWNQRPPTPRAAATAAGLVLPAGVEVHALTAADGPHTIGRGAGASFGVRHLRGAPPAPAESRPDGWDQSASNPPHAQNDPLRIAG